MELEAIAARIRGGFNFESAVAASGLT